MSPDNFYGQFILQKINYLPSKNHKINLFAFVQYFCTVTIESHKYWNCICVNTLSKELINAYCKANYEILVEPTFSFKIGQKSPKLINFLHRYNSNTAAYVTAFNPLSKKTPYSLNLKFQEKLYNILSKSTHAFFEGRGNDPDKVWPEEPGFLILSIPKLDAVQLGRKFNQNAIVWIEIKSAPKLVNLIEN